MKLSIVVPFRDEKGNVEPVVARFAEFADRYDFELICVDDASKDGTDQALASAVQSGRYPFLSYIRITPEKHRGYGHAIMTGVQRASGDVIAWTHSDLQTDPADVFRAFDAFDNANIIVKGKRIGRKLVDIIFSGGMAVVASIALGTPLFEINAQPKLFHKDFMKHLADAPDDFSLDLYLLYHAKRNGFTIKSIDVRFKKRRYGESKWATSFGAKRKTIIRTIKYIGALRKRAGNSR